MVVVKPRLASPGYRHSGEVLLYRGVFVDSAAAVADFLRIGVLVWYLHVADTLTKDVIVCTIVSTMPWMSLLSRWPWDASDMSRLGRMYLPKLLRTTHTGIVDDRMQTELIDSIRAVMGRYKGLWDSYSAKDMSPTFVGPSKAGSSTSALRQDPVGPSVGAMEPGHQQSAGPSSGTKTPSAKNTGKATAKTQTPVSLALHYSVPNGLNGTPDSPPVPACWELALIQVSPLPAPSTASHYVFPPNWLFCIAETCSSRYYHFYPTIHDYLQRCVVEGSLVHAEGLKIQEWQDVLYGDYVQLTNVSREHVLASVIWLNTTLPASSSSSSSSRPYPSSSSWASKQEPSTSQKKAKRHAEKATVYVACAKEGALRSYNAERVPVWRGLPCPLELASNHKAFRQEVQWDVSETLFRMELLAMDHKLSTGTAFDIPRSANSRHVAVARIWDGVLPDGTIRWLPDMQGSVVDAWVPARLWGTMDAFHALVKDWPGYPFLDSSFNALVNDLGLERVANRVVAFYVQTFVQHFSRLPIPPCHVPQSL